MRLLCAAIIAVLAVGLGGCPLDSKPDARINLERVPKYYRDCVEKVVSLPKGSISQKEAIKLLAKVRSSELRLSKCGKDVIAWADKQVAVYAKNRK